MPRRGRLFWFVGKAVFFLVLLALIWPFIAPWYSKLLVWPANKLLALSGIPVVLYTDEEGIKAHYPAGDSEGKEPLSWNFPFGIRILGYYGIIVLVALFLATPGLRALKKLELTAVGLGIMFFYHVVDLALGVRIVYRPTSFYNWAYMLSTFGQFWIPVMIWGLLTFHYWLPRPGVGMVNDRKRKKQKTNSQRINPRDTR